MKICNSIYTGKYSFSSNSKTSLYTALVVSKTSLELGIPPLINPQQPNLLIIEDFFISSIFYTTHLALNLKLLKLSFCIYKIVYF